jgi:dipeptidyl aminopeptidase/acylaminoacyl peptidase
VTSGARACKAFDLRDQTLLFASETVNAPAELWVKDLASGEERPLTDLNAAWRSEILWPDIERITVASAPGVEIEGWVLKPQHAPTPVKTLLFIHGGPHAAYGHSFNEDFQEMVGAGYAVAYANPRGSLNYGDAFAEAIVGVWGLPELEDFTAFLDEIVRRGVADPDALGVTGVSGGGHLSGWLIGHTDRFKAAVPEQGLYNMFSMYGVSDAGVALIELEMGGPPHERAQRYWELSPIAYAHKVKTPTLLIQGENDVRCPMEQAEQFYTVLKHNGCEAELLRLNNCNHAAQMFGPPPLRRVRMDAMKDWFARHIP